MNAVVTGRTDGTDGRRFARRLLLMLVALSVACATQWLYAALLVDGLTVLELCLLGLFIILFAWIAASFWMTCVGTFVLWRGIAPDGLYRPPPEAVVQPSARPRTAIVMAAYNEDARRIFAGIEAIYESLGDARDQFDFYILSDSTNPACVRAEELAWFALRRRLGTHARIFYRHRSRNIARKSGNIADFCERWGALYDYMVVLDADSLMTGETLARLVVLMDANPRVALIQAPPALVGRNSLFARIQQFCVSVYGPIYNAGLAYLYGADSNYWGHNAIIRVRPFMQHCGLPALPGHAPLGGEILSHDFVEAALLRRAGWKLCLAPELSGSYEETPPTVMDHLKRDQRWCQGNMQHLRLLFARGLHGSSRMHFLIGAMSYLASPLWLLMLVLSVIETLGYVHTPSVTYVGRYPVLISPISHTLSLVMLVLATVGLLLGPKLLALAVLLRDPAARRAHNGAAKVTLSVLLEAVFSTVAAPVFMLTHSWFVVNILLGRSAQWNTQQREDHRPSLAGVARLFLPHTILGAALGVVFFFAARGNFWWLVPVIAGLVLAVPFVLIASDPVFGRLMRRWGLFAIPSEVVGLPVMDRMNAIMAATPLKPSDRDVKCADVLHAVLARETGFDGPQRRSAT